MGDTGSADGFAPPAFKALTVHSFNDGKMKQEAIYISHTHGCLLSMDNEPSAVRGTMGNSREMGKPPPCSQLSAVSHGSGRERKGPVVNEGNSHHDAHLLYFKKNCTYKKLRAGD